MVIQKTHFYEFKIETRYHIQLLKNMKDRKAIRTLEYMNY